MLIKNLQLFFTFVLCFFLNNLKGLSAEIDINPNYSAEQKKLLNDATKAPNFLIADQLKYLYPKNFISSDRDALSQNIALSLLTIKIEPLDLKNLQNLTSKNNLMALVDWESINALNDAYLGLYKSSKEHYEKTLTLLNSLNNIKNKRAIIYKNLAYLYYLQNNLSRASFYNQLLIENAKSTQNNQLLISSLIFQANILLEQGQIKNAENMILKNALLINNGLNGKKKEQACYLQLGKIYLQAKRFTEAKWFFIQSLTFSNQLNLKTQKIESLLLLAQVKNRIKDYSLALADLKLVGNLLKNGSNIYQDDFELQLAQTYSYLRQPVKGF